MIDEPEKKKKTFKLVSKKSTRKVLSKWKKLESTDKSDGENEKQVETHDEISEQPRRVLGLRLCDAVAADPSLDGLPLPSFFRHAIDYVEENGLTIEGIYRLSPPKSRLDELERRANCGEAMVFTDVHEATGLIKRFLRQIPEPLLPVEFEHIVESCRCGLATNNHLTTRLACTCGTVVVLRDAMEQYLDIERRTLFAYVFLHAQHVMLNEHDNKMGLPGLGLLLQTVLEMSRKLVCFCSHAVRPFDGVVVSEASYLLDETVKIDKYIPPRCSAEIETWKCENRGELERELMKQNFLLTLLHNKISARHEQGARTSSKLDEELWQVQGNITAIKRKLKQMGDSRASVSSTSTSTLTSKSDTRCIEIYEEKQLMATQGMLREDIGDERRRIASLCWELNGLRGAVKEDVPSLTKECVDGESQTEMEWKERCELEEAARSALLEEISRLRSSCALFRARLELASVEEEGKKKKSK